jgi:hypothetical protein
MESNCWCKSAANSSEYPKIMNITQIGNIGRQKENLSNYACEVVLNFHEAERIEIQACEQSCINRIAYYLSDSALHI